ncbi:YtpI family protein [Marinicrinis lubricantis]
MTLQFILTIIIVLSLVASVYYSTTARSRKTVKEQGISIARMNIAMGMMLVSFAVVQIFLFGGSAVRYIVGFAFLILGLVNIYGGTKNYRVYAKLPDETNLSEKTK